MSKFEQRDLSGSLFKNEDKQSDNHPDYKGDCIIDGQSMWVSAWIKTAQSGRKYMSLAFKPKQAPQAQQEPPRQARQAPRKHQGTGFEDMDSALPF